MFSMFCFQIFPNEMAPKFELLNNAYIGDRDDASVTLEEWCSNKLQIYPQFKIWYQILLIEIDVMLLIRSIKEYFFSFYIDSLKRKVS